MLVISAAKSYTPEAYLTSTDGSLVKSQETIKILGFNFDTHPNVSAHMKVVQRKFKCRLWSLRHLKKNGFSKPDLVKVYKAMILPVAEYCSAVFHPLITKSDSNELERIQMQALKGIFGWNFSYSDLLLRSGLDRLDVRRERRFISLAEKMVENPRFAEWFPKRL